MAWAGRRAEVLQKAVHATKEVAEAANVTATDIGNRTHGFWARLCGRVTSEHHADGSVLVERVRSKLGRVCSHPSLIEVTARNSVVQVSGPILRDEMRRVLGKVSKVPGVRAVENRLEPRSPEQMAGQNHGTRRIERPEPLQENWSPAWRLLTALMGAGLMRKGVKSRGLLGTALGIGGIALLLRSITNLPFKRLVGLKTGPRAVTVRKTINVGAPVEEAFAYFSQFANFPKFMRHVRDVQPRGAGRWRWSVDGPAGAPIWWEAEVTELTPNQLICWRSVEGSAVKTEGRVRFDPAKGGTRIDIQLFYNPPGGAIGHALASLLGANPKKELDHDMLRLKSLLESGKTTGHEKVTLDELAASAAAPSR